MTTTLDRCAAALREKAGRKGMTLLEYFEYRERTAWRRKWLAHINLWTMNILVYGAFAILLWAMLVTPEPGYMGWGPNVDMH